MRIPTILVLFLGSWVLTSQADQTFEIDPWWPKPLPEGWINAQVGGVCVDSQDNVLIVDRRNITEEEMETNVPVPTFVMFDMEGNVIKSWGDPDVVPQAVHGCSFDSEDNVWVAGNQDAIVQKYSHDGELLMQIGTKLQFDTETARVRRSSGTHQEYCIGLRAVGPRNPATSSFPTAMATSAWSYRAKQLPFASGQLARKKNREAGTPGTHRCRACIERARGLSILRPRAIGAVFDPENHVRESG